MQTCEQLLQQCSSVSVKARLRRACVESSSAWTTKYHVWVIRPRPFLPKVVKYSKLHVRISGSFRHHLLQALRQTTFFILPVCFGAGASHSLPDPPLAWVLQHNHLQNLPKTSKNKRQKCSDDFQFQQLSCPKKQANPRPVRIHSPLPITRLLFQHASLFCLSILLSWLFRLVLQA